MSTLERAIEIAVQAHRGQLLKNGSPYILHPLHLMLTFNSVPEQIVAVLHDVVEDTNWTLDDLLREGFSPEVIEAIGLLTHADSEPYDAYIERVAKNPIARRVKMADLKHNMDITRLNAFGAHDAARLEKYHRSWLRLNQG
jgi:(p)ppGpp synthase/HD superfamily hydrolase